MICKHQLQDSVIHRSGMCVRLCVYVCVCVCKYMEMYLFVCLLLCLGVSVMSRYTCVFLGVGGVCVCVCD